MVRRAACAQTIAERLARLIPVIGCGMVACFATLTALGFRLANFKRRAAS